jgi:putative tricarboxylic transport membrane protein
VLAPVAESELRSGLMASGGSFMPLVERPIALTVLLISAALFVWPFYREWRKRFALKESGPDPDQTGRRS